MSGFHKSGHICTYTCRVHTVQHNHTTLLQTVHRATYDYYFLTASLSFSTSSIQLVFMVPNSVLFSFSSSTLTDAKSTITPAPIHYHVCTGIATHKHMYLSYTRYMKIFVFYEKYKLTWKRHTLLNGKCLWGTRQHTYVCTCTHVHCTWVCTCVHTLMCLSVYEVTCIQEHRIHAC